MGWLIAFCVILWITAIVGSILTASAKGYSKGLAFLLSLFIPAIGSLIFMELLPDIKFSSFSRHLRKDAKIPQKRCTKCGKEADEDYSSCPSCGSLFPSVMLE